MIQEYKADRLLLFSDLQNVWNEVALVCIVNAFILSSLSQPPPNTKSL